MNYRKWWNTSYPCWIADWFHLLSNLSDALDTYFKSISGTINRLIKSKISKLLIMHEAEPKNILVAEVQINDIRIDPRLDRFNKVKELQANEVPILRISKDLGRNVNAGQLDHIWPVRLQLTYII